MKLADSLLLYAAIGTFLLWILEIRRSTSFVDSYWLLVMALSFLLGFQYMRLKRRQQNKEVSPTIRQIEQDRANQKKAQAGKQKNKK